MSPLDQGDPPAADKQSSSTKYLLGLLMLILKKPD